MITLNLPVTEKHIKNGKARTCSKCPFALAILDKFSINFPIVGEFEFSIVTFAGETHFGGKLSKEATYQICWFDIRKEMAAGIYQIQIPDEWECLITDKTIIVK